MHVAILGAGAMGTMCTLVLESKPNLKVSLWARRTELAEQIARHGENADYLPAAKLRGEATVTADAALALTGVGLIVVAVPTVHLRATLETIAPHVAASVPVLSVAKGVERDTFYRPSQIIEAVLGPRPVAAMCGPCHAEEVGHGLPATVVVASEDAALAEQVQDLFSLDRFRVYTNQDLLGAELAAALKNVIAIAAGVSDGLGFGDNAKSALLTRGLVELVRFCTALGGQRETLYGLAGIGDLITTCISPYGRNRAVGMRLGQGDTLDHILATTHTVAEGVWTARAIHDQALQLGIDMPISTEVYRVLYQSESPREAVKRLFQRSPKSEWA